MENTVLKYLKI